MKKSLFILVVILLTPFIYAQDIPSKQEVIRIINKVNNHWIDTHPNPAIHFGIRLHTRQEIWMHFILQEIRNF